MTQEPWDDDRIAAAYRQLATRPTPAELADLRVTKRAVRRRARPAIALPALAAAAAVVVVGSLAGVALLHPRTEAGPSGLPVPTVLAPTPLVASPSATSSAAGEPSGLVPIGVTELVALQQGAFDDREIAVHGFLSPFLPLPCPSSPLPLSPLELGCPAEFRWLMAGPQLLTDERGFHDPTGAAVQPRLREASGDTFARGATALPREVIALGHLDDPRWTACPADQQDACRRAFVVDRIVDPAGYAGMGFPEPWSTGEAALQATDVFGHLSELEHTLLVVLSAGAVDGRELATIEPAAAGVEELVAPGTVWRVRILDPAVSGRASTFFVREAWVGQEPKVAWELTPDGPVRREAPGWFVSPSPS
jgi:hypothetical protein